LMLRVILLIHIRSFLFCITIDFDCACYTSKYKLHTNLNCKGLLTFFCLSDAGPLGSF